MWLFQDLIHVCICMKLNFQLIKGTMISISTCIQPFQTKQIPELIFQLYEKVFNTCIKYRSFLFEAKVTSSRF